MRTWGFPQRWKGWGMKMTTYLSLGKLKTCEAIPSLPHMCSWYGVN
jgi:hypothetical protein